MFDIHRKEITWGGRPLSFETGRVARQADGAVIVQYEETTVMATVVAAKQPRAGIDFFPLTVDYVERTYAAGKIPGGFFKREGRPSEKETLTCRLIDRPIRPLFVDGFRNETQVICTVLSHDLENDPDIIAMIAASAALTISGIPFMGPIGGCRVGYKDGEYILNPHIDTVKESELDLVVAGTRGAVLMVESEAKELSEDIMLGAVMFGHQQMQPVIDAIIDLAEACAKEPWELTPKEDDGLGHKVREIGEDLLRGAYEEVVKLSRQEKVAKVKDKIIAGLEEIGIDLENNQVGDHFKSLEKNVVRGNILDTG
ncbi:MAG TPA: polyribonucleotide nucleotidyltransferase, partial [Alphaproteobacteria bacterium]|nr:polyribonucleotide nucleotidyltransferase [Alphaproteobacteria bacterium]HBF99104.1 polyribonucleotide nucleotidyltransferase [Alphaproteobacteria bacterium]